MITLSITSARKNLGAWIQKAMAGEEVGILAGNGIVALRPVKVVSMDYVESEYGIKPKEMKRIAKKLHRRAQHEKKSGKSKPFHSDLESLLKD